MANENKWLNVNELATILAEHYGVKRVHIDTIYPGGNRIDIGSGAVLDIEITLMEEE